MIVDILTLICSEVMSPHPPLAAVTVGKQYATPQRVCVCVCLCEQCTVICLTKHNPVAHSGISNGYDDEAFWQIFAVHTAQRT